MLAELNAQDKHFVALLLCLAVVLALGRLVGIVFRAIKQPVVIGEVLVGIALGPSLLGQISPSLQSRLFNVIDIPFFKLVASLGLVLFMFIVGLEVDLEVVRRSGKRAAAISLTSIAVPFALGFFVLGNYLHADHSCVAVETGGSAQITPCSKVSKEVAGKIATRAAAIEKAKTAGKPEPAPLVDKSTDFVPFAIFIAVSMCVTAFPVLARILAERNMFKIPLGLLMVACAAIDDLMAFTLLALATALAGQGSATDILVILAKMLVYVAVLFIVVRPLLERFVLVPYRKNGNKLAPEQLTILFIGLMLSAYVTSNIGVHEIIGGFLFGVAVPRNNAPNLFHSIADRIEGVSVQLLLPVFFVIAGQGVNLQGLTTSDILPALAIIAIACVGKFVGASVAARAVGVPRRQSLAVGALMNTRGLTELIVLTIGRDSGVIDDKLYTLLVIMAVVTTAMAGPLLKLVYPDRWLERDIADAERKRTSTATDRVAILVDDITAAQPLADLAAAYGGGRKTGSVTIVRLTPQGAGLASFADDLGEMKTLRETIEQAGLTCQIISRSSVDRAADVAAEIERLAPSAVVISASDDSLVPVLRHLGCDVLIPSGSITGAAGVTAHAGGSSAELAAVEIAVRIALANGVPLHSDGLSSRLARQIKQLGVERVEAAPAGAISVGATTTDTVVVHPGERDRVPLDEALGSWVRTEPLILSAR
ncbi:MAG: sodium/hydrogen exchanger [Ilumatobacteraceae bacterium]|nr:sodium/hydrogen exchanger [Ilumatobacteraceae bacterium]